MEDSEFSLIDDDGENHSIVTDQSQLSKFKQLFHSQNQDDL